MNFDVPQDSSDSSDLSKHASSNMSDCCPSEHGSENDSGIVSNNKRKKKERQPLTPKKMKTNKITPTKYTSKVASKKVFMKKTQFKTIGYPSCPVIPTSSQDQKVLIEELQKKILEKDCQVDQLKSEKNELNIEIENLKTENSMLSNKNEMLSESFEQSKLTENANKEITRENCRLKKQMEKMQISIRDYQRKSKNLKLQNSRLKCRNDIFRQKQLDNLKIIDSHRKKNLEHLLDGIGHLPSKFIQLIMNKAKRVNWKSQDRSIMELCLSLYFKSPSCYETLRRSKLAPLPSANTLRKQYAHVFNSGQGVCPSILEMLKEKSKFLDLADKHVALSFDGMSIKPSLKYDPNSDTLIGFSDTKHPSNTSEHPDLVNQGVVMMIRTLGSNFKQIIGYHLVYSSMPSNKIDEIIRETVGKLKDVGLIPVAVVMDQEASQRGFVSNFAKVDHLDPSYNPLIYDVVDKCWQKLSDFDDNLANFKEQPNDTDETKKAKTKLRNKIKQMHKAKKNASKASFEVKLNDNSLIEIFPIFDVPHLIKSLRNNFLTKDIIYCHRGKVKKAKFEHLLELHRLDNERSNGCSDKAFCPRLTLKHLFVDEQYNVKPNGNSSNKMKVSYATQLFSHSVYAGIKFFVKHNLMPKEALETAEFCYLVNKLFDFTDSRSIDAPGCKKAVSRKHWFKDELQFGFFYRFVSSWSFVSSKADTDGSTTIPCHKGWLLNLKTMKALSKSLCVDKSVLSFLCLNRLNQDHVENCHSMIRSKNGANDHPEISQYVSAIRTLSSCALISDLLGEKRNQNCQSDGAVNLLGNTALGNSFSASSSGVSSTSSLTSGSPQTPVSHIASSVPCSTLPTSSCAFISPSVSPSPHQYVCNDSSLEFSPNQSADLVSPIGINVNNLCSTPLLKKK